MGMWSDANTKKTLTERVTGREPGRVVRNLSEDEDFEEMGMWPAPDRRSRKDRKIADQILKDGKPPRKGRGKK